MRAAGRLRPPHDHCGRTACPLWTEEHAVRARRRQSDAPVDRDTCRRQGLLVPLAGSRVTVGLPQQERTTRTPEKRGRRHTASTDTASTGKGQGRQRVSGATEQGRPVATSAEDHSQDVLSTGPNRASETNRPFVER